LKVNGHERPPICDGIEEYKFLWFTDDSSEVKVTLTVENHIPLQQDFLELSFIATAYVICDESQTNLIHCYTKKCISDRFANDGYHNCPMPDCVDEHGCTADLPESGYKTSTKYLTAVTSVLFFLFSVLGCFWFVTSYLECCGDRSSNTSARATTTPANPTENRTMETSLIAQRPIQVPSAPPIDDREREENKEELPPSYDSLFSGT
jgi:hypothetical protein